MKALGAGVVGELAESDRAAESLTVPSVVGADHVSAEPDLMPAPGCRDPCRLPRIGGSAAVPIVNQPFRMKIRTVPSGNVRWKRSRVPSSQTEGSRLQFSLK